jgi:hypothetical protein
VLLKSDLDVQQTTLKVLLLSLFQSQPMSMNLNKKNESFWRQKEEKTKKIFIKNKKLLDEFS